MADVALLAGAGVTAGGGSLPSGSFNLATNFSWDDKISGELEPFISTNFQQLSLGATGNFIKGPSMVGLYVGGVLPSSPNVFWGLQYTHGFDMKKMTISPQVTFDLSYTQPANDTGEHCDEFSTGPFASDVSQGGCGARPLSLPEPGNRFLASQGFSISNSASLLLNIPLVQDADGNSRLDLELAPGISVTWHPSPAQAFFIGSANLVIPFPI